MIHIRDQDFNTQSRDAFGEAFLTHTSTSPNQQLLASLDLARRQVDIEGFQLVRYGLQHGAGVPAPDPHRPADRQAGSGSWTRPTWCRRSTGASSGTFLPAGQPGGPWKAGTRRGRSDEFVLDPTRVTLFIGKTGMNGFDFREKVLMERFGIQINKTSINSVLLIFTIGVTWSSVHYPARRAAPGRPTDLDRSVPRRPARPTAALQRRRVEEITEDLPALPDFSEFDIRVPARRPARFGDMRSAFYAGYEESDREYVPLGEAGRRIAEGTTLVSTTFVVPYPPGFPVLVPGQVVSKQILYFLAQLDVKEIHGYNADLGLSVFTEEALQRIEAARDALGRAVKVSKRDAQAISLTPEAAGVDSSEPNGVEAPVRGADDFESKPSNIAERNGHGAEPQLKTPAAAKTAG